ncbi:hypothetical protein [Thioclava kandeliae]|uniref:Uncharacterized protein n=1 Tax=Thioclava kandeliae TaxID=3070818 RepID=A0ABV1SKY2_9RHOB
MSYTISWDTICMCRIGSGEPRFPARFKLRSRHFRLHPHTSSGWTIPFRSGGGLLGHACGSCLASHFFLTEFCAVKPHPMEKNGEFTGDGHNGSTPTFGAH